MSNGPYVPPANAPAPGAYPQTAGPAAPGYGAAPGQQYVPQQYTPQAYSQQGYAPQPYAPQPYAAPAYVPPQAPQQAAAAQYNAAQYPQPSYGPAQGQVQVTPAGQSAQSGQGFDATQLQQTVPPNLLAAQAAQNAQYAQSAQASAVGQSGQGQALQSTQVSSAVPGCLHAYPLAVTSDGFFAAARLVAKTMPFSVFRVGMLSLVAALSALALTVSVTLTAVLAKAVHPAAGGVVFLVSVIAFVFVWLTFVNKRLFAIDCAHTAILTELITKGTIENGSKGQFAYGQEVIEQRFGDFKDIYEAQGHVNYIVGRFLRTMYNVTDVLPFDISAITNAIRWLLRLSTRYVGQTVLSYSLARGDRSMAKGAVDGLCYYAQNSKPIVKTSISGLVIERVLGWTLWVLVAGATGAALFFGFGAVMPTLMGKLGVPAGKALADTAMVATVLCTLLLAPALSGLFAWAVREATLRPIVLTMTMLTFHRSVRDQALDPSWKKRLTEASDKLDVLDNMGSRVGIS